MRVNAPLGTNGTIVVPEAGNKTVTINGMDIGSNGSTALPENVVWAGFESGAYRVNVTSGKGDIVVSTS
jgi:hypothetical protein